MGTTLLDIFYLVEDEQMKISLSKCTGERDMNFFVVFVIVFVIVFVPPEPRLRDENIAKLVRYPGDRAPDFA